MKNRERIKHPGGGEVLTQQHMADQADLNKVMERAKRGVPMEVPGYMNGRQPMFMNLTGDTYHDMLIKVQQAEQEFMSLPARIRRKFSNNPEMLVRFANDPKNIPELVNLGLMDESQLPEEYHKQQDLLRQQEAAERAEFQAWKAEKAKSMPKADPEANPRGPAPQTT